MIENMMSRAHWLASLPQIKDILKERIIYKDRLVNESNAHIASHFAERLIRADQREFVSIVLLPFTMSKIEWDKGALIGKNNVKFWTLT